MIQGFFGQYRFLSNFYPSPVTLDDIIYPTVEHAYQAAKVLNPDTRERIRQCRTPGEAKSLQKHDIRQDWNRIKYTVMYNLLIQKFSEHEDLKRKLLDTYPEELEETNTWNDTYWGVCNGVGDNNLGKLLKYIRDECIYE